jgi:hypothetical protein
MMQLANTLHQSCASSSDVADETWHRCSGAAPCRLACTHPHNRSFFCNAPQDILDEWLQCQQGWLYLEPIFGSEDIMQQMPNEGRKFKSVDATWRRTMEKLAKNCEVLVVTADEELLKNLREANRLLEQVGRGKVGAAGWACIGKIRDSTPSMHASMRSLSCALAGSAGSADTSKRGMLVLAGFFDVTSRRQDPSTMYS